LFPAEAYVKKETTKECDRKYAQYYLGENATDGLEGQTECHIRNINCSR